MKIIVTEVQLEEIISKQGDVDEQEDPTDAQPSSGASDTQTGAKGYPEVTTWSKVVGSKLTRGVANPIGNEPRPDLVNREGPANQITEQNSIQPLPQKFTSSPVTAKQGDYLSSVSNLNKQQIKITEYTFMHPGNKKTLYGDFTETTVNKVLLDIREFMFSGWGLIAQFVVSIAGAEIGAPIAIEAIDALIIINDIDIFAERGINQSPPDNVIGVWERFKWLCSNNQDFLRLVEDAAIILTAGIGAALKGGIKGAEDVIGFFSQYSKKFAQMCEWIANGFLKIRNALSAITMLPKFILDWLREKVAFIDKIVEYFKNLGTSSNKFKRAVSKIPTGVGAGLVGALVLELGVKTLSWILGTSPEALKNPNQQSLAGYTATMNYLKQNSSNTQKIDDFIYRTKVMKQFPNIKRNLFSSTTEKNNGERVFIINNQKYIVDQESHKLVRI